MGEAKAHERESRLESTGEETTRPPLGRSLTLREFEEIYRFLTGEGLSYTEIAEGVGVSPDIVRSVDILTSSLIHCLTLEQFQNWVNERKNGWGDGLPAIPQDVVDRATGRLYSKDGKGDGAAPSPEQRDRTPDEVFKRELPADEQVDPEMAKTAFQKIIKPSRGPENQSAQRMWELIEGRECELVPIQEWIDKYSHTKKPRKDALSALGKLNKAFEREGEDIELATPQFVTLQLRRRSQTSS